MVWWREGFSGRYVCFVACLCLIMITTGIITTPIVCCTISFFASLIYVFNGSGWGLVSWAWGFDNLGD